MQCSNRTDLRHRVEFLLCERASNQVKHLDPKLGVALRALGSDELDRRSRCDWYRTLTDQRQFDVREKKEFEVGCRPRSELNRVQQFQGLDLICAETEPKQCQDRNDEAADERL
jgi:hypothetical protein